MTPAVLDALHQMTPAELREVIAAAAGLHAHRDQDNGEAVATVLRRIADRLSLQPMRAA